MQPPRVSSSGFYLLGVEAGSQVEFNHAGDIPVSAARKVSAPSPCSLQARATGLLKPCAPRCYFDVSLLKRYPVRGNSLEKSSVDWVNAPVET